MTHKDQTRDNGGRRDVLPGRGLAALLCAAMVAATAPAAAREAGTAVIGHQLARRWCASCHVIDPSQPAANLTGAPSFAAVAAMPSTTEMSLRAFLLTPHAPMPDFQLSHNDIDNVTAYILSLKRR